MNKYYEKAQRYIDAHDVEEAITAFISGLERGDCKCAYGIVRAVMQFGSYTMTDDEAISIFASSYSEIRLLAEEGDTEAMVMVAEGIRYGFVDDDDEEPYLFWLFKAAALGDKDALSIIEELDLPSGAFALPSAASVVTNEVFESMDEIDHLLLDTQTEGDSVEWIEDLMPETEDHVLLDQADWAIREDCGINDYLKTKEREYELRKCRDDVVLDG